MYDNPEYVAVQLILSGERLTVSLSPALRSSFVSRLRKNLALFTISVD